jgi:hypothetical protein
MKKIFLKIKNPGIMFQLGNKKFRSPVEIDVTHLKVDNIISQMKTYGITDFEITTNEISTSSKEKQKSNVIIIDTDNKEIEKLNLKIDQMEKVLKELLNQNKREQNNVESKKIKETQIEIKPEVKIPIKPKTQSQPQLQPIQEILKKVVIEELEEIVEEPKFNFITKDFKLGTVDPFTTLPDIDQLKVLKKK